MLNQVDSIIFEDVVKEYRLYHDNLSSVLDFLGVAKYFFWRKVNYQPFLALNGVSFNINKGERVGFIGRNGAGKTTILKLITQNFEPTKGKINISGNIQSLMDTGVGFHPDYTGLENIRASLIYSGLRSDQLDSAIQDIIEFVELGQFLNQPIKTYSLGMLSRLGFATATAVNPDILIIDEVLGAGDAYFVSKSAERMKKLTSNEDTTLILVSHATSQILQFCDRCIWIEKGEVVDDGPAMQVVKRYDKYILDLENSRLGKANADKLAKKDSSELEKTSSNGGLSRWDGVDGLKISGFRVSSDGKDDGLILKQGQEVDFIFEVTSEFKGEFDCKFHMFIFTLDGIPVSNHVSPEVKLVMGQNEKKEVSLKFSELLLSNSNTQGEYVVTVGVYKELDLNYPEKAKIYDLLDRSFRFKVIGTYSKDGSLFKHPEKWHL